MPGRYHAQRQHVITSLDILLYQLHTLSFLLSPSIWSFICRLLAQFQCSKPREFDTTSTRTLKFFFANILFFNLSSLWYHATQGTPEGRAIILDFIGLAYVPSKIQLLGLDILIICLQMILTVIAYETSYNDALTSANSDTQDFLLPVPSTPHTPLLTPLFSRPDTPLLPTSSSPTKSYFPEREPEYVIDLTFSAIVERLRRPPPPPADNAEGALPLPTTTPWPLPAGMRMLLRARGRSIANNTTQTENNPTTTLPGTFRP